MERFLPNDGVPGGIAMELRNCPECGKLFAFLSRNLCPECAALEDEYVKRIQEYLDGPGGATIKEISDATEVPEEKIISLLREGRLIVRGKACLLECERCGKPIDSGRYCASCRAILANSLKGSSAVSPKPMAGEEERPQGWKKARMHTAGLSRASDR
ncbi:flagellar protein YvyF [Thermacetogenium phaeum DSM 12270]|uniref:Flagellar protein YvyF n=2 Tax=Thermacetogenium phaeum TaxID=85874 RepID=K4LFH0_THEPS|nr:flagellar protein YvyF [Thermacetogenium phaeum]AFV10802.1 flagellar protein YvyF [Thermacetogenium phaeum DSM 12270]